MTLAGGVLTTALRSVERWAAQACEGMHRKMSIDEIADVYKYYGLKLLPN
jgi:hypothetical protein